MIIRPTKMVNEVEAQTSVVSPSVNTEMDTAVVLNDNDGWDNILSSSIKETLNILAHDFMFSVDKSTELHLLGYHEGKCICLEYMHKCLDNIVKLQCHMIDAYEQKVEPDWANQSLNKTDGLQSILLAAYEDVVNNYNTLCKIITDLFNNKYIYECELIKVMACQYMTIANELHDKIQHIYKHI